MMQPENLSRNCVEIIFIKDEYLQAVEPGERGRNCREFFFGKVQFSDRFQIADIFGKLFDVISCQRKNPDASQVLNSPFAQLHGIKIQINLLQSVTFQDCLLRLLCKAIAPKKQY